VGASKASKELEEPTYRFKILSPKAQILDEDVISVVAPGETGYFGVLANHAPFITTMTDGELKVRPAGGGEKLFRITGGIFRVAHNLAILLTESIEEV
jgi:F-type H+-transporting ATPase subunit epsilon